MSHAHILHPDWNTRAGTLTEQTPWWLVSTLFHALLIALIGMLTISINLDDDGALVSVTTINIPKQVDEPPKPEIKDSDLYRNVPLEDTNPLANIGDARNWLSEAGDEIDLSAQVGALVPLGHLGMAPAELRTNHLRDEWDVIGPLTPGLFNSLSVFDRASDSIQSIDDSQVLYCFPSRYRIWGTACNFGFSPNPSTWRNMCGCRDLPNTLQWLAHTQESDGHWDAIKHGAEHKNDTAVTSLALMAFLSFGETEKVGEHRHAVRSAVKWLIGRQNEDGLFQDDIPTGAPNRIGGYPQALATMALCEAAANANIPATRAAAQKAVDYCVKIQSKDKFGKLGWRYAPYAEGDLSVTAWYTLALKSARVAGLKVDYAAFDGISRFVESVEVKQTNGDASTYSCFKYTPMKEDASATPRLSAMGTTMRHMMGWKSDDLKNDVEYFIGKSGLPQWGERGEKADLYYWYFAANSAWTQDSLPASRWMRAMKGELLAHQSADGSWEPVGAYANEWGRVGQTGLAALCLRFCYVK